MEYEIDLFADEAAEPMFTLLTERRLLSKLRSKFNPET